MFRDLFDDEGDDVCPLCGRTDCHDTGTRWAVGEPREMVTVPHDVWVPTDDVGGGQWIARAGDRVPRDRAERLGLLRPAVRTDRAGADAEKTTTRPRRRVPPRVGSGA